MLIIEAKWEKLPPRIEDMAKFMLKVDGKLESVRGLFVAMAGFDEKVLDHIFRISRGTKNNLILMDKKDLIAILDGILTLKDALTAKVDAAEQEGKIWHPLGR